MFNKKQIVLLAAPPVLLITTFKLLYSSSLAGTGSWLFGWFSILLDCMVRFATFVGGWTKWFAGNVQRYPSTLWKTSMAGLAFSYRTSYNSFLDPFFAASDGYHTNDFAVFYLVCHHQWYL